MAKGNEWQPILGSSDFSPNSGAMVNRLAGASSAAGAVENVAKIAISGLDQYGKYKQAKDLSNVREQVGAAIDPLIQEGLLGSPSYKKEQTDELATWQESMNRLPLLEAPEDPEVLNQGISRIQGEVDKKINYLTRARDQGRMSSFVFEQNIKAISRKFISDNPALRNEILDTVKNTLEDQGIVERLKFDEQLAKDDAQVYENEVKSIRDNFEKFNIPELPFVNPNGTLDLRRSQEAIDVMRRSKMARDAFMADSDYNKRVNEEQVREVETSGVVPLLVQGQFNEDMSNLSSIFTDGGVDFPKAKLQAKAYIAQQALNFKTNPRITRWMGSQVVKEGIADYEKQLTALEGAMESFNSLEDFQKYSQNTRMIMQDKQSMNLMKDIDVPRFELLTKVGGIANLMNSKEGQGFMVDFIKNSRDLFTSGKLSNNSLFNTVPNTGKTGIGMILETAAKDASNGKQGSSGIVSEVINAFTGAINDPKLNPTQRDSWMKADEFIKQTSNLEYVTSFIDLEPQASTQFIDTLTGYNDKINTDLQKYFTVNPTKNVKVEINPATGMLYAQGADADFNGRFTSRINNALKSYANFRAQTPKEVWKDFYGEYYPSITQGQTTSPKATQTNNPLNLKDTKGQFRSFNSLDEAVGAYENQLLSYYEGKGVAGGKPRTTIKDIVDLWRPASDRRGGTDISQEKYYEHIADALNTSPRRPLDLSNKETMAKLIASMASIESGSNLEWLRVSSFLKKTGTKKSLSTKALESTFGTDNFTTPGKNE